MKNIDKIRKMNRAELAKFLIDGHRCADCFWNCSGGKDCHHENCIIGMYEWLDMEVIND